MASSGTISSAFLGYKIQIAWSVTSQSAANNTSEVTANVQLVSTGSSWTISSSTTKNGSLSINGTSYAFTFNASLTGNQTKTIFTKSVTVPHNADGTKTCSFSCSAGINVTLSGTYYGNVTASGTGAFNAIARATTPTLSASTFAIGSAVTISTPRAVSTYTHTLTWVFGNQSGSIASGVGTSYLWTVPMQLCFAIPNGTTGTGSITCKTYSGSTLIGTKSISFTATVPASVVPTISSVSLSEATTGIAAQFGGYVQGKSKLNVSVAASGIYYSSITSYKVTVDGATFYGQQITSGILATAGSKTVSVTVTDSRGRSATTTRTITVIAYTAPKITSFSCIRCNADGTENPEGTYLKANINFNIASVNSKNTKTWSLQYKRQTASSWTTATSGSVYTYNSNYVSTSGILSTDYAFDIKLVISDFFSKAEKTVQIGTAFTLIDFNASGKGVAFGKVSERTDAMEIDMQTYFTLPPIIKGGQKVLWTGGWWMNASQTAQLSEPITSQANGVVLVFSRYLNDEVQDNNFIHFFIPKSFMTLKGGYGHSFMLAANRFGAIATKYLYINNGSITGHADNTTKSTINGITFDNTTFVMRYVIGV